MIECVNKVDQNEMNESTCVQVYVGMLACIYACVDVGMYVRTHASSMHVRMRLYMCMYVDGSMQATKCPMYSEINRELLAN